MDYEPVAYFYNSGGRPTDAIAFSHYGTVLYRGLQPWDDSDYSPRFPNMFHTPVLRSREIEVKDGILSRGALAAAHLGLVLEQKPAEPPSAPKKGLPPKEAEIYPSVLGIVEKGSELLA